MNNVELDERAKELAGIVVDYSTEVREGDLVRIAGQPVAWEFMEEIARRVIDRGGIPFMAATSPNVERHLLDKGNAFQRCHRPGFAFARAKEVDVNISVYAQEDPLYLEGVDPNNLKESNEASKPLSDIIVGDGKGNPGKRWCVVGYPTKGQAEMGGLSLPEWEDAVYSATNVDWPSVSERLHKIKDIFDAGEEVRIAVPGLTDLKLSLKGRKGEACDGRFNMPDAEVFYGPVEDSAEGVVTFSYPAVRQGNVVEGITLTYKDGKLVDFDATKGKDFLASQLAIDGADRIGELGIGGNPGITRYMKNLLFDEKIDGTIHLAVGMSYPFGLDKGGGLNKSALHWDLVCELRKIDGNPGGNIYVDGDLVQENGIWVFEK